jgi:adenosylhomocysteine nucleosidase
LRIAVTGIGRQRARAVALRTLVAEAPALVLTCGFAGGLNPSLPRGAVVCATDEAFPLEGALSAAGAVHGRFFCADRILVTVAEKAALWQQTGADAVEMESEAIRAICLERRIPSATVRVISDAAGEELPLDFNRLSTPDFRWRYARLAAEMVRCPGKVFELIRFRAALGQAAGRLAEVLAAALG